MCFWKHLRQKIGNAITECWFIWSALPSRTVWSEICELDVLHWTERQPAVSRAEKRDLHTVPERLAVSGLLETRLHGRHARPNPMREPEVKLRDLGGKPRLGFTRLNCQMCIHATPMATSDTADTVYPLMLCCENKINWRSQKCKHSCQRDYSLTSSLYNLQHFSHGCNVNLWYTPSQHLHASKWWCVKSI